MAISQLNNSEKNGQYDSKDKEDMEYIKNGVGEIPFKPAPFNFQPRNFQEQNQ